MKNLAKKNRKTFTITKSPLRTKKVGKKKEKLLKSYISCEKNPMIVSEGKFIEFEVRKKN